MVTVPTVTPISVSAGTRGLRCLSRGAPGWNAPERCSGCGTGPVTSRRRPTGTRRRRLNWSDAGAAVGNGHLAAHITGMCMARTHVLSSTALGVACAAPLAGHVLDRPMPVATLVVFAALVGGFGVLPDLDHPQATLARTLGPVTKAISQVVHNISGGHRKGTHTVWAALLVVALVTVLATQFGRPALIPVVFIGFYLFVMILRLAPHHRSGKGEVVYALEAAAATAGAYYLIPDWWFVAWAAGFGVIGHIIGDVLTTEGVPILYPLAPKFVVRLPLLGRTDSAREHGAAWLLVPVIAWMVFAVVFGHQWWDVGWLTTPPSGWTVAALR